MQERDFEVSIHAPAWGATILQQLHGFDIRVSIHAPAWGATKVRHALHPRRRFQSTRPRGARPRLRARRSKQACFNPRARVGRDANLDALCKAFGVSIHAPAWGATGYATPLGQPQQFQSTRPRGARRHRWCTSCEMLMFQSTRPRGARRTIGTRRTDTKAFQSTRPRGARRPSCAAWRTNSWFQSTRPRGARRRKCNLLTFIQKVWPSR